MTLSSNNPGEVRFVSIADPHFSEHSPASWKADYRTTLEGTVSQVLQFAEKQNVDAVLWPGDIFNVKSPSRYSIGYMISLINLFKRGGLLHLVIAGNHDYKYGGQGSLDGQPLGLLLATGSPWIS
jgi:DNA repair exonuclease SbcCD nuclease subunit